MPTPASDSVYEEFGGNGSDLCDGSRWPAAHALRALLFSLIALFVLAPDAVALNVEGSRDATVGFAGVGCEQTVTREATALLPVGARRTRLGGVQVGDRVESSIDTTIVAVVTAIGPIRRDGRRVRMAVTVGGDPSTCASEMAPLGAEWQTEPLDLHFDYRRSVHVYFPGSCCGADHAYRPHVLSLGASFALDQARWRRWDGPVATGSARLPFNDCIPYCAAGTTTDYRVSVRLSRPRSCNGVQQYLALRYRYQGRRPLHASARATLRFGYRCE